MPVRIRPPHAWTGLGAGLARNPETGWNGRRHAIFGNTMWRWCTHPAYAPIMTARMRGAVAQRNRAPDVLGRKVAEFESRQPTKSGSVRDLTERVAVPPMEDGEQYWLRMWENGSRIARPDSRRRPGSRAVQQVRHHSCPDGGAGSIPDRPTRKNNHASKDVVQCPKPCQTRPANRLRPPDAD